MNKYYSLTFPASISFEKCSKNSLKVERGWEKSTLESLLSFNNYDEFRKRMPHELTEEEYKNTGTHSLDIKGRDTKYRIFFKIENNIAKITELFTEETHKRKSRK